MIYISAWFGFRWTNSFKFRCFSKEDLLGEALPETEGSFSI